MTPANRIAGVALPGHSPGCRRSGGVSQALRWNPHPAAFIVTVALVNAALYHGPLYTFAVASLDWSSPSGALTLATVIFLTVFVTTLFFALVAVVAPRLLKPLCMVAAPVNAVALYFIQTYGVLLDRTMMGNVLNTDWAEAGGLFHPKLLAYLLVLGAVPCAFLFRVRIRKVPVLRRVAFLGAVLLVGVAWMYAGARTWLWIDDNAKRLGGMTLPWSYVVNASRVQAGRMSASREQAPLPAASFLTRRKTLVVLVIGEAARPQDFSLYGYARPTNPRLAEAGVVALPRARACSTYTTASVLCILSHLDPGPLTRAYETLPSYLQRHGIDVIWRTTNWGEPPLQVQTLQRADELRQDCQGEACGYDEVLLHGLDQRIRASTRDQVFVVLHQSGSHGPAYYEKYPKRFEAFTPACKSVDPDQCTAAELVNAYDNTIVYTDHFLNQAIELLKAFPERPTLLMYVSDHGESLGEHGLYLHGTPYAIAPDVQKDIPFLVWMSGAFRDRKTITPSAFTGEASHSQAEIFHSVMGAFDMRSAIYDPSLDLFGGGQ